MNWEAIGAVGQILGSIAVFVTLGYLAVQVRQASKTAQRALSQGRSDAVRELYAQLRDDQLNRLFVKVNATLGGELLPSVEALIAQSGLTEEEATQVFYMYIAWWNHRLEIIPYVDELPAMERTVFDLGIRSLLGRPGVYRFLYDVGKSAQHPDAVRYVDNLLAQPG